MQWRKSELSAEQRSFKRIVNGQKTPAGLPTAGVLSDVSGSPPDARIVACRWLATGKEKAPRAKDEHHQVRRILAGALELTFCPATPWSRNLGSGCGAPLASPARPFSC